MKPLIELKLAFKLHNERVYNVVVKSFVHVMPVPLKWPLNELNEEGGIRQLICHFLEHVLHKQIQAISPLCALLKSVNCCCAANLLLRLQLIIKWMLLINARSAWLSYQIVNSISCIDNVGPGDQLS